MRLDLHVHAAFSKQTGLDLTHMLEMLSAAWEAGLDTIGLVEHLDTRDLDLFFPTLDDAFPYDGFGYRAEGLRVIPGLEIAVREGPHMVVLGDRSAVTAYLARLQSAFPYAHPAADEALATQEGLDLLNILAHPLRPGHEMTRIDPRLYPRFDALDLNATDLCALGLGVQARTQSLSQLYRVAVVAGSGAHHPKQLGSVFSALHKPFDTVEELRRVLGHWAHTQHIHSLMRLKVAAAREAEAAFTLERLGAA